MAKTKVALDEVQLNDITMALDHIAKDSDSERQKMSAADGPQYARAIDAYLNHAARCRKLVALLDSAELVVVTCE